MEIELGVELELGKNVGRVLAFPHPISHCSMFNIRLLFRRDFVLDLLMLRIGTFVELNHEEEILSWSIFKLH